jgi:hypothetical protein
MFTTSSQLPTAKLVVLTFPVHFIVLMALFEVLLI